jgi:hypothetical protein
MRFLTTLETACKSGFRINPVSKLCGVYLFITWHRFLYDLFQEEKKRFFSDIDGRLHRFDTNRGHALKNTKSFSTEMHSWPDTTQPRTTISKACFGGRRHCKYARAKAIHFSLYAVTLRGFEWL